MFLTYVLIAGSIVSMTVGGAGYCLYTAFFQPRRWYDRTWRVIVAVLVSYVALLFFFGDS